MPTFNLTLAQSVRIYGCAEVEADSFEDAIRKAAEELRVSHKESTMWDNVTDASYDTSIDATICSIECEESGDVVDDIALEDDVAPIVIEDVIRGFRLTYPGLAS